jgi:hypothetical protein
MISISYHRDRYVGGREPEKKMSMMVAFGDFVIYRRAAGGKGGKASG